MRTADDTRELSAAAWVALAAAFLVMAGQFAVAKRGLSTGLTAYDIVALRFVGAAIPAAVILGRRGVRDLGGVGYGRGAFLALIAGSPYALLMYLALRLAPAAHGAMLIPGVGIVVATVIGASWVGERHGRGRYVGIVIVLAGLSVLGAGAAYSSPSTGLGDLLLVGGGIEWGLFTLVVRRWQLDALAAAAALSLLSLVYLPVYLLFLRPGVFAVPLAELLLQAGYQGVLLSVLAFAAYAFAIRRLGAGTAAIGTAAIPVLGTVLAIVLVGESPSLTTWIGLVAVCLGIAVANVLGRGGVAQATASAEIVRTTPISHSDRHVWGERTWPSRRS
jgi:drug/metabolite transporter (DMT)-like permease